MKYQRVFIDTIGYELAPEVVTSSEIEERLAPLYDKLRIQPGQLEQMTGICERRFWEPGMSVSQGAALAAHKALEMSEVPVTEMQVLIYGAVCRQHYEPATACHVAAALQQMGHAIHPSTAIFDVSNACLGVLNGMLEVANRIELGQIRAGMVVACESARDIVDITIEQMLRQSTMEQFIHSLATLTGGSGAVAVVLSDGSFGNDPGHRLLGGALETAPQHHMLCRWGMQPYPGSDPSSDKDSQHNYREFMQTDPVAVLEHGVTLGGRTWNRFLQELHLSPEQIDRTVCHQVGSAHRETILASLGMPREHDFVAYEYLGNTGTVALPTALALADEREFIEPGMRVAMLGIGSGLNCMMLGAEW